MTLAVPPTGNVMQAVRHVMVPLDGSPASEEALLPAAAIARRAGARITLVHVRKTSTEGDGVPDDYPAALRDDSRLGAGVPIAIQQLPGPVTDELLAFARDTNPDVIVMTSRGRGGTKRALCGSVADAIIRRAELPVLLVKRAPGEGQTVSDTTTPFKRVLVPVDGSLVSEAIIPHLIGITGTAGVHLILLRIHPALTLAGEVEPGPPLGQRPDVAFDSYLPTLGARVSTTGVAVSWRAVMHALNAETIMKVAIEENVDLIAMTTSGAGGADRLLFGSVADVVVRQAPQDVLVVRPPRDR
jgi:nucleotide-binding universal stress UspA family protein